jgi:hypothetical protein
MSASDHGNSHHPPVTDVVNITLCDALDPEPRTQYVDVPSTVALSGGASGGDLCPSGGPHEFHHVSAENEKRDLSGGVQAIFMGTGGGVKAKNSRDKGQRVVLYCKKCGKHKTV